MQFKPLTLALTMALAPAAQAANLSDVYRDAQAYDAQYAAARAAYQAGQEKAVQGRAGLLPNVNLGGNVRYNDVTSSLPGGDARYDSNGLGINASQPLFRKQNFVQYEQAKNQTKIADMQFKVAEQDLIVRVAQAYFDVLQSQDNIAFINAQKSAITEQLASAKRNFEVGTATITDTHEAQARFDLAVAQEIAEQNSLNIRLRALEKLIGKPPGTLDALADNKLLQAEAISIDEWAERASKGNLQAEIQRLAKAIADQEVERNRAGHYPTLDAVAGYTINNGQNFGATQLDTRTASVGVELNLPIYQGGLTNSRVREAVANQEKARQDLEGATRDASLQARQAWLNVNSGVARVRALEQALVSTKAQLDSTKLGLEVGVRTNLDVLNAEQQVLSARRDLAGARYAYLLSGLSLKAAVGSLSPADLAEIDQYLNLRNKTRQPAAWAQHQKGTSAATRAAAPRWRASEGQTGLAHAGARRRIVQQLQRICQQVGGIVHPHRRARFNRQPRRLLEVEGMRPHQHRPPHARRLDQVLPAQRHQTAADESHIARRVIGEQLAQAVAQQHPRLRFEFSIQRAAALIRQPRRLNQRPPPRRNAADGAAPAPAAPRAARCRQTRATAAPPRLRACSRRAAPGAAPFRLPGRAARELRRRRRDVEFEIAGHRHRARPQRHQPRGIGLGCARHVCMPLAEAGERGQQPPRSRAPNVRIAARSPAPSAPIRGQRCG